MLSSSKKNDPVKAAFDFTWFKTSCRKWRRIHTLTSRPWKTTCAFKSNCGFSWHTLTACLLLLGGGQAGGHTKNTPIPWCADTDFTPCLLLQLLLCKLTSRKRPPSNHWGIKDEKRKLHLNLSIAEAFLASWSQGTIFPTTPPCIPAWSSIKHTSKGRESGDLRFLASCPACMVSANAGVKGSSAQLSALMDHACFSHSSWHRCGSEMKMARWSSDANSSFQGQSNLETELGGVPNSYPIPPRYMGIPAGGSRSWGNRALIARYATFIATEKGRSKDMGSTILTSSWPYFESQLRCDDIIKHLGSSAKSIPWEQRLLATLQTAITMGSYCWVSTKLKHHTTHVIES